jgi:hypothetical protein|tara:strand:- start:503 stop:619 length:117 start_codon:yes stop_codon:yes gene_type:complete
MMKQYLKLRKIFILITELLFFPVIILFAILILLIAYPH